MVKHFCWTFIVFVACTVFLTKTFAGDSVIGEEKTNHIRDAAGAIAAGLGQPVGNSNQPPTPAVPTAVPATQPPSNRPIMESGELWQFALRACQEGESAPKTDADFFPYAWPGSGPQHDTRQLVEGYRITFMPLEQCPKKGKLVLVNDPLVKLVITHKYKSFADIFVTTQKGELKTYIRRPVGGQPIPMEPTSVERDRFQKEKDFWISWANNHPAPAAQPQPKTQRTQ